MPPKKWSDQKIIDGIQELSRKGEELTDRNIRRKYSKLYNAGKKYFGSWSEALKTAGFDSRAIILHKNWSDKAITKQILGLYHSGEDLTVA